MDSNKREQLRKIGYRIPSTCGTCIHSNWNGNSVWGECSNFTYEHLKHSDKNRFLSIYRGGICPSFELSEGALDSLNKFREFVE